MSKVPENLIKNDFSETLVKFSDLTEYKKYLNYHLPHTPCYRTGMMYTNKFIAGCRNMEV